MKKIAIIGAGVSSLSAAHALENRGHEVVIFEKSRGYGGRASSKRLDFGSLDIGAQYFTAKSKIFKKHVRDWQNKGHVSLWPFMPYTIKNGAMLVSPDTTDRFVGSPGMNSLCHALAEPLKAAAEIRFSTRITQLSRVHNHWIVGSDTGESFGGFDSLIVAIPAEQARELLGSDFALAARLPQNIHRPCWALGLATRGKADLRVQGIFGDDTISWVSRQNSKPGRAANETYDDLWMLHFSPEWSSRHGKETTEDIEGLAKTWLEGHFKTSLDVIDSYRHFWRYANIAPNTASAEIEHPFLFDPAIKLALIGDWCAGGRIEGAFLSGLALVEQHF